MKSIMDTVDSLFKYDSPFMLRASRVAGLIGLNLLWLVCCIPVFTIGPATVAMNYVIFQHHTGRSDQILRPFFRSFRRDFWQGILLGVPMTVIFGLLCFNGLYIYGNNPDSFTPLWIPFALMLFILCALVIYGFPLMARYSLSLKQIISNSLVFFIQNPKFSVFATLGHFLPVLLAVFVPVLLQRISFIWVLLGNSTIAFLCNKKLLNIFGSEETEGEDTPSDQD